MKLTKRSFSRLSIVAVAFGVLLALGIPMWGQQAPKPTTIDIPMWGRESLQAPEPITVGNVKITGLPEDWTHHYLIFSNPGTEEDAIRNGTHDKWLKIVNDPRYIIQQLKRRSPAQGPAAEDVARINEMARAQEATGGEGLAERQVQEPTTAKAPVKPPKATIHRDWSMNMGPTATVGAGMFPAKYSFTPIGAANCASVTQPDFVVYNTSAAGSAEVAASQTGSFTGQPTGGQTVTIGGTEVLTASAPTAATTTGAFSGTPATSSTLTITGSGNTLILTAKPATQSTSCTYSGGSATVYFANGTNYFANLKNLINTSGCGSVVGVSASGSSPNLTITATTPGAAGNSITLQTTSSPNFYIAAWTGATPLAGGLDASNTGTNFAIGSTDTVTATNLASAITRGTVGVSASSSGLTVTVTATTPGLAGDSITLAETLSNFTWAGSTLASGTDGETIIAYDNLYSGCSGNVPLVYWEYNTAYPQGSTTGDGSTIKLSVTLSWDGTQVAFVESNSSNVASLVVLKWASNPSVVQMDTSSNVAPSNYRSCSAPCMTRITFSGSPNDTNSPPFYDYSGTDTLYVGDDSGVLHEFTGVFLGTPDEAGSPWPVTVSSGNKLSGPVYNAADSLVYVGDNTGYLYSVNPSGTTLTKSVNVAVGGKPQTYSGIVAPPIVDSRAGQLYAFTTRDLNGGNSSSPCYGSGYPCTGVINLPTGFSSSTGFKESVIGGYASAYPQFTAAFDENYWSTGTGFLYTNGFDGLTSGHGGKCPGAASSPCPKLGRSPVTTSGLTATTSTCPYGPGSVSHGALYCATNEIDTMTGGNPGSVSPVTEIYNGTTDYIFLSMSAYGALTGCTGSSTVGCVYSFNTTNGNISTTPVAGLTETGGTSGIIADNTLATTGASQIYFSTLANQSCAGNGTTGSGTGGCAVQVSQSTLQ